MGKTHRKQPQASRSRTTRSHKPRLFLSDPTESSAHLASQLGALGLYPADTVGDGNCLFRALSDQLYGSPSKHPALRQSICDFIVANKPRYEPFCEDERGLDVHIRCMRENGTYGGHLELSSFAHMVKRNVKVVQPGLVYVIEWAAGLDEEEKERDWRKRLKEEEREGLEMCQGTIYVAYHDWEHFSSIRNLNGPHAGLPNVVEAPAVVDDDDEDTQRTAREREKEAKKERERQRKDKEKQRKITRVKLKLSAPPSTASTPAPMSTDQDPTHVPLPLSRSTSTSPTNDTQTLAVPSTLTPPSSSTTTTGTSTSSTQPHLTLPPTITADASTTAKSPHALSLSMRVHRSPKRSFDESASSEDGQSVVSEDVERGRGRDKRSRMGSVCHTATTEDTDAQVIGDGDVSVAQVDAQGPNPDTAMADDDESSGLSSVESDGDDEAEQGDNDDDGSDEEVEDDAAQAAASIALDQPTPSPTLAAPAPPPMPPVPSLSTTSTFTPATIDGIDDEGYSSLSSLPPSRSASPAPQTQNKVKKVVQTKENGKPLTRRERKALGLPKHRGTSAGKIVIPGGKFKGRAGAGASAVGSRGKGNVNVKAKAGVGNEEWVKSGVGRVDVRGFRELKI